MPVCLTRCAFVLSFSSARVRARAEAAILISARSHRARKRFDHMASRCGAFSRCALGSPRVRTQSLRHMRALGRQCVCVSIPVRS